MCVLMCVKFLCLFLFMIFSIFERQSHLFIAKILCSFSYLWYFQSLPSLSTYRIYIQFSMASSKIMFSTKFYSIKYFSHDFNYHLFSNYYQIIFELQTHYQLPFEDFYWMSGTLEILMNEQQYFNLHIIQTKYYSQPNTLTISGHACQSTQLIQQETSVIMDSSFTHFYWGIRYCQSYY